jgi:hypothetical protein
MHKAKKKKSHASPHTPKHLKAVTHPPTRVLALIRNRVTLLTSMDRAGHGPAWSNGATCWLQKLLRLGFVGLLGFT